MDAPNGSGEPFKTGRSGERPHQDGSREPSHQGGSEEPSHRSPAMTERGTLIAIDLDGDRMTAVAASVSGSAASVRAWLTARRPERLDAADAAGVGAWIRDELTKADFPRGPWVMAVGR